MIALRAGTEMPTIDSRVRAGAAQQRGVTLLEMSFVLIIAGMLLSAFAMALRYLNDNNTTTNLANGLDAVYNGGQAYVTHNYAELTGSAKPVVAGFGNPMKPTVYELRAARFLGNSTSAVGYTGGRWEVDIRQIDPKDCPGPMCSLGMLVYLDRPVSRAGRPALDLAAGAAIKAKVPAGFSGIFPYNNVMTGLRHTWRVDSPKVLEYKRAALGAFGTFPARQHALYLPRSGAMPMQGDLQMTDLDGNSHSISGVKNLSAHGNLSTEGAITAEGPIGSQGNITAEGNIAGQNLIAKGLVLAGGAIFPGAVVQEPRGHCGSAGAVGSDRNGTIFTCSLERGKGYPLIWQPLQPAAGTLCGMGTKTHVFGRNISDDPQHTRACEGHNPAESCPAGYERSHFYAGVLRTDIWVCVAQ